MAMDMDFKDCRRLKQASFSGEASPENVAPLTRFPLSSKETEFPASEVFS
jgi:hypothetical protein